MSDGALQCDILVIGSGPAGHKAAIQGAKAKRSIILVEEERGIGGACVHHGTIPSKTLRETAVSFSSFRRRTGDQLDLGMRPDVQVGSLMLRLGEVVKAHEDFMGAQLLRNGVVHVHGRARFVTPHEVEVRAINGKKQRIVGDVVIIATGSRPRTPPGIPVDHEHILDSDSVLSMLYLPASLTIIGAGVIGSEYASIFASLGVKVVVIDRGVRPVSFFDPELTERLRMTFEERGGRFIGESWIERVEWDGVSSVVTTLRGGEEVRTDKLVCALGRIANVESLGIGAAGLTANARGLLDVDEYFRTKTPHIYAVGDVIGPPSLASTAMDQGRRASCHALGIEVGISPELIPIAVYTIPEMASVGLTEEQAIARNGSAIVGRASFRELARGQIAAVQEGILKLVTDPAGKKLVGVQIIGEGASELIHVGQMALIGGFETDVFVENVFNFPTLAEGYRVAALDVAAKRSRIVPDESRSK